MENREGYVLLNSDLLDRLEAEASASKRRRKNYNFHQLPDTVQRMVHVIQPDSYVRPHRHTAPPKDEFFLVLRGAVLAVIFNDDGDIIDCIKLGGETGNTGLDVRAGIWHSIISLQEGSAFFEAKTGPYDPAVDKDFAVWAPAEGDAEAGEYMAGMKRRAEDFLRKKFI